MKQLKQLTILLLMFVPFLTKAQLKEKFTVSGIIKDKATGETLSGATVSFLQITGVGVTTNSYGFYSITVSPGKYTLIASFAGYIMDTTTIDLTGNKIVNLEMTTNTHQLKEVVVSALRKDNNITKTLPGVQRLSTDDIKNIPVLFGEKDILKTIQLLPGIKSAGDGRTGFYVRGGTTDQNLILLDEATVYNASHLLGFFSVFNSDAIKDITVYKGGMPAVYGGRLSSVEDIKMKDGNNQKTVISGGLGLISSRLNIEGPIVKDKGSFFVSARRTYADLFLGLSSDTTIKGSSLYFYDINLKANYRFNENNRVFLSGYFGKDILSLKDRYSTNWGNSTATLRWNHVYNRKLFSNTSLIYSDFNYNINILSSNNDVKVTSHITDYHLKQDFNYFISTRSKLDIGLDATYHIISPGAATVSRTSSYNPITLQKKYALEDAVYISHEWSVTNKVKFTYGLRLTAFTILGPGNLYSYDQNGKVIDTATYANGKVVKTYFNPEPRFDVSYQLNEISSIKFSYTRNVQNIHLLNNSTSSSPNSLYIPSSLNVLPEIADQISLGYYRNFHNNMYEFSSEIYYKNLQNQIDYKNEAQLLGNETIESQLLYGNGRAYGLELYIKKKQGRMTGWISYTLSRTEKQINGINFGNYYPASQDQTHNISVVGIYKASKKWSFSATWVYNTGNAVTWPSGKFPVDGVPVYLYTSRNGYRMPVYHRLDLGATLEGKRTARFESSWTFSIYNVYGHANPYTIAFQQDPKNPAQTQALQTSLFKMVPSITYNFKF